MSPDVEAFFQRWLEEAGGAVSFEAWMREALHHPAFGYYASRVRTVGYRGDFSTGATLHRGLAEAVAAWASARRAEHFGGRLRRWHLVEIGPGGGDLAAAMHGALPIKIRACLVYHVVETSPRLRERQRERLAAGRSYSPQNIKVQNQIRLIDYEFIFEPASAPTPFPESPNL